MHSVRRAILAGAVLAIVVVAIPNLVVWRGGREPVTDVPAKVPHAQAALVLGAQVYRDGKPSIMPGLILDSPHCILWQAT